MHNSNIFLFICINTFIIFFNFCRKNSNSLETAVSLYSWRNNSLQLKWSFGYCYGIEWLLPVCSIVKRVSKPFPFPDSPHPIQWCSSRHRGLPIPRFHMLNRLEDLYLYQYRLQWLLLHLGAISSHSPYRSPSCAAISGVLPLSPTMATQQYPWMLHSDRSMLTVLLSLQCSQSLLQIWQQGKKMPGINSSADLAQLIVLGHI